MEFDFSEDERLLQLAVSDFAQRELANKEELLTLERIPTDIIEKMGGLGFLCLKIPEKYGGESGTWVEIGLLCEEIAKANAAIAHLIMISYEVSLTIAMYAKEETMEEWLPSLVRGKKIGCISATEFDSGLDFASIKTIATKDSGLYIISGEKSPVSFGMQADITILFARSSQETGGGEITAFLVPLNLPGVSKTLVKNMGLVTTAPASLIFNKMRIPVKYRIGDEDEGFRINSSMGLFSDFSRVMLALISLGLAQNALSRAVSYAKGRMAFGRAIAAFEAISGKIAEDATLVEAGRWLCYRALWLKDQGLPNTKETAMCGWWCPKVSYQVIEDALLIHGHAGYSSDLPFQQMLRDLIAFEIIGGTEQFLKVIVAEKVIGRSAIPESLADTIRY